MATDFPEGWFEEDDVPAPELAKWENANVKRIYEILCDDMRHKRPEEHWEGYCARWIVAEIVLPLEKAIAERDAQWQSAINAAVEKAGYDPTGSKADVFRETVRKHLE